MLHDRKFTLERAVIWVGIEGVAVAAFTNPTDACDLIIKYAVVWGFHRSIEININGNYTFANYFWNRDMLFHWLNEMSVYGFIKETI